MKTRVILVNFEYPPIAGPGIWRVFALSRDLHALGHDVTVVCSDRSSWHELRDESLLATIPAAVRVVRLHAPLLADWRASLQARAQAANGQLARRGWEKFRHLLEQYIPDPAVAWGGSAARPSAVNVAADRTGRRDHQRTCARHAMGRSRGVARPGDRWIMDYRDLWTSDPTHVIPVRTNPAAARAGTPLPPRRCHAVVSVAPSWLDDLREMARARCGRRPKLRVIRNGHDLTPPGRTAHVAHPCRPSPATAFQRHAAGGDARRGAGAVRRRCPLRTQRPDLPCPALTFTGISARHRDDVPRARIEDVRLDLGYRPQDEALRSRPRRRLLVLVDGEGRGPCGIIPAKTYESMALGRHVLAIVPPAATCARCWSDYGNASVCDESSEEVSRTLEALCERLRDDPASFDSDAARRLQWMDGLSRQDAAREFADLIGRVIKT